MNKKFKIDNQLIVILFLIISISLMISNTTNISLTQFAVLPLEPGFVQQKDMLPQWQVIREDDEPLRQLRVTEQDKELIIETLWTPNINETEKYGGYGFTIKSPNDRISYTRDCALYTDGYECYTDSNKQYLEEGTNGLVQYGTRFVDISRNDLIVLTYDHKGNDGIDYFFVNINGNTSLFGSTDGSIQLIFSETYASNLQILNYYIRNITEEVPLPEPEIIVNDTEQANETEPVVNEPEEIIEEEPQEQQLIEEIIIPEPICGNGIKEAGENCDGGQRLPEGFFCTDQCTIAFEQKITGNVILDTQDSQPNWLLILAILLLIFAIYQYIKTKKK